MTDMQRAVPLRRRSEIGLRQVALTTLRRQQKGSVRPLRRPARRRRRGADGALVEQAKGVLMLRYGVGSYEALAALARWSRDAEVDLPEIARLLVHGVCQGRDGLDDHDRCLVRWIEQRLREDIPDQTPTGG